MEKPKAEVGNRVVEFTVADGKFPNHIMTVGLCRAPNEIHYVAHRAWDSGTVSAKMFPSVSFKSYQSPTASHPVRESLRTESISSHSCPDNQLQDLFGMDQTHSMSVKGTVYRGAAPKGQLVFAANKI